MSTVTANVHRLNTAPLAEWELALIAAGTPRVPVLFCRWCGTELDEHDVAANIATYGLFVLNCSDCCEGDDGSGP